MVESTTALEAQMQLPLEQKIDGLATAQQRVEWALAELRRDVQGVAALLAPGSSRPDTPGVALRTSEQPTMPLRQVSGNECQCDFQRRNSSNSIASAFESEHMAAAESMPAAAEDSISALQVAPSLPLCWPASLNMRQGLDLEPLRSSYTCSSNDMDIEAVESEFQRKVSSSSNFSRVDLSERDMGWCLRCMVNPTSTFHAVYTLTTFAVLMYDLMMTPYLVAWEISLEGFFAVSAWMSATFWTLDIFMSFRTGYTESDRLEMRPWRVAMHFAKTWFVPDFIFVGCDWTAILLAYVMDESASGSLRVVRFAKLGKMLRVMGIFRMMKVARVIDEFAESCSATLRVSMRCLLLLMATIWLNHVVGCAWFAVGKLAPADTGVRWVDYSRVVDGVEYQFLETSHTYQYVTAVHWSVAQFTLGAIEIGCSNSAERLFNVVCLMLGLLFGSTLVSILSATMVEYQMQRQDQTQKMRKLRRFLRENNVNPGVALLVQQQASERLQFVDKIQEKDVKVLELLSRSLRTDLRYDIAQPHLCSHPLFRLWTVMDASIARSLVTEAMEDVWLLPQDDLFVAGTSTDKAYHLATGSLLYTQYPETSAVQKVTNFHVQKSKWLSEAALWSYWIHVGTAKAEVSSQMIVLLAEQMVEVLRRNRDVREITLEYRRHYHRRICVSRPPEYAWPSDLEVPCTEYGDLVFSMNRETQVGIGLIALEQLVKGSWHRTIGRNGGLAKLKQEIIKGKCCIMMSTDGQIERVVSVVALHIESLDGSLFCELGQLDKQIKAACQLPGAKRDQGELDSEAMQRILTRLRLTHEEVTITCTEQKTQHKQSREYGVQSRYLRNVHFARLTGQLSLPVVVLPESAAGDLESIPAELVQTNAYVSQEGGKRFYYAWLPRAWFDRLRSPEGDAELHAWLAALARSEVQDVSL